MGSVEIGVMNKNCLNITDIEEITRGGITYSIKSGVLKLNGTATSSFDIQLSKNIKIKKGKYTHSSSYIQSGLYISFDNLGYTMISATVGKKRTFEITEDTTYKTYFIWIDKGMVLNNVEIKLQLEIGDTTTDFIEHQSQTTIMPIQQEMLNGDYISNVEHHEWGKLVLTGEENWIYDSIYKYFRCPSYTFDRGIPNGSKKGLEAQKSNYFEITNDWGTTFRDNINKNIMYGVSDAGYKICIRNVNCTTVEQFKAWLKSKYDEGKPVVVYYQLLEPVDLELTSEQKAVRDTKLYTYKNITNISLSDELASIDIEYKKDLETMFNNIIKQMSSSTSDTTET